MGVAEWRTRLVVTLPMGFRGALPGLKESERALSE